MFDPIDVGSLWTNNEDAPPPVVSTGRRSKKPYPYWSWLLPLLDWLTR